jgi:predicted GNAT family acetyltransferase
MVISMEDRDLIRRHLMKDPYTHLFHLCDLDEHYTDDIRWFVRKRDGEIAAVALLFQKPEIPVFQCFEQDDPEAAVSLMEEILSQLPDKLYCHLSDGPVEVLKNHYWTESKNRFMKMRWPIVKTTRDNHPDHHLLVRLTADDEPAVREFVPEVYLDSRLLSEGFYYGVFEQGRLVSVGGTSLFSRQYGAAVIGSVGTVESHRRRGFCARIINRLTHELSDQVSYIGLNVRSDNEAAIRCYLKCGFEVHSEFWECWFTK